MVNELILNVYALPGIRFKNNEAPKLSKNLEPEYILSHVCDFFKISSDEIKKKSRKTEIVYPRQVAIYLICKYSKKTLREIGAIFYSETEGNNRDHSAAIHARDRIKKFLDWDDKVVKDIQNITQLITEGISSKTIKDIINEI